MKYKMSLVFVVSLAACGGGGSGSPPADDGEGGVRFVNGIPDSNGLAGTLAASNLPNLPPESIPNIAFGASSPFIVVSAPGNYTANLSTSNQVGGTASFSVDNILPSGNTLSTVFAYGSVTNNTANTFVGSIPQSSPPDGFELQIVHLAYAESQNPNGKTLTFYLVPFSPTGPDTADVSAAVFQASIGFGPPLIAQAPVVAGKYGIVVVDSGGNRIFETGFQALQLPSGASTIFQIVALDTPPPGVVEDPCYLISLLILDNTGGSMSPPNGLVCGVSLSREPSP